MSALQLSLLTPASVDPVSIEDLKAQLREDGNEQNDMLLLYIRAATEEAQNRTRRQLITATFEQWFAGFANPIELAKSPLLTVDSVEYLDANGDLQTLATSVYESFKNGIVGQIKLKYGQSWPATRVHDEAVKVTYQAGYGSGPENVPASVRQWILAHAASGFRDRELGGDRPITIHEHMSGLLDPVRIPRVA